MPPIPVTTRNVKTWLKSWSVRAFLVCCCSLISINAQSLGGRSSIQEHGAPACCLLPLSYSSPRPVVLISEVNSTRAIAFDSVTFKKEPFALASPFAADGRTRVMLFALNLPLSPGDDLSVLTAKAEDAAHRIHMLKVEYVAPVAQLNWLSAVVLRFSDSMVDAGDVLIQLHLNGNPRRPGEAMLSAL
jgi:hypothetical protein